MPTLEIDASDFEPAAVPDLGSMQFSNPGKLDLGVYRGDSGTFRVTVTRDGVPLDVSTATWDCDIRDAYDATVATASMTVVPVVGEPSKIDVNLAGSASALLISPVYAWDLQMTLAGQVQTIMFGTITVIKDVSRA